MMGCDPWCPYCEEEAQRVRDLPSLEDICKEIKRQERDRLKG